MTDQLAAPIDDTCRDCGELIPAGAPHLPGLCGPCSIPEQQDRERGRSTEGEAIPTREAVDAEEGALIAEYEAWLTLTGRPDAGCANELRSSLYDDEGEPTDREAVEWLDDFCDRWGAWERRSHARYLADKQEAEECEECTPVPGGLSLCAKHRGAR